MHMRTVNNTEWGGEGGGWRGRGMGRRGGGRGGGGDRAF